jgi:asparagine synthase (glutamine-hydrolysing)
MMAEREVPCLLSGGLDSSLITALVAQNTSSKNLKTFSIGISGSIDLEYAKHIADYIKTNHFQIDLTKEDFLNATETVLFTIESFDTTTVRASIGNYLVSKYISEHIDSKVIFNGKGSDEACCGYVYLKNVPTQKALQKESERLIR